MKNRVFTTLIYITVLVLAFSLILRFFGVGSDDLAYSEIVELFQNEQVKSFVVTVSAPTV